MPLFRLWIIYLSGHVLEQESQLEQQSQGPPSSPTSSQLPLSQHPQPSSPTSSSTLNHRVPHRMAHSVSLQLVITDRG